MQIEKILVAVDFSPCSEAALDQAGKLATSLGRTVDIIHVWDIPVFLAPDAMIGYPAGAQPLARHVAERARAQMDDCVRSAKTRGIPVGESFVLEGNVPQSICDKAESGEYDLLVLGTRGRTGLRHLLLGSVAETVVRHSKVPCLTVRCPVSEA